MCWRLRQTGDARHESRDLDRQPFGTKQQRPVNSDGAVTGGQSNLGLDVTARPRPTRPEGAVDVRRRIQPALEPRRLSKSVHDRAA